MRAVVAESGDHRLSFLWLPAIPTVQIWPVTTTPPTVDPRLGKAQALILADRKDEALAAFAELAREPALRHDALGNRAWLLRGMGRYDEALAHYEEVLGFAPTDGMAQALRAETLILLGRLDEAREAVVELVRTDPCHPMGPRLLARWQEAAGVAPPVPAPPPSYERLQPVRPINPVIEQLESAPSSYPISSFPEIGRFLYTLVRCMRPRVAVETGCFVGYSTLCIAQALEENNQGHLHSFDLFMERPDYESPVVGPCTDCLQIARGHLEAAALAHRVTLHKGDSSARIAADLHGRGMQVDFAYVDGDHMVKGCFADWNALVPLVADGGVVMLHDVVPDKCGWAGPRALLEELGDRRRRDWQWVALPSPEGYGVALIQKQPHGSSHGLRPPWRELLRQWLFYRTGKFF